MWANGVDNETPLWLWYKYGSTYEVLYVSNRIAIYCFCCCFWHTLFVSSNYCVSLYGSINFSLSLSLRLIQSFCFVCFIFMIIIIFNWSIFTRFNSEMILFEYILSCEYVYCVCINRWRVSAIILVCVSFQYCFVFITAFFFSINFVWFLIYL